MREIHRKNQKNKLVHEMDEGDSEKEIEKSLKRSSQGKGSMTDISVIN